MAVAEDKQSEETARARPPAKKKKAAPKKKKAAALTPRAIIEEQIPSRLVEKKDVAKKINALVHLAIAGPAGGKWTVDLTKDEDWVTQGHFGQPRILVSCGDEDFVKIASGEKDAKMAVFSGALKFEPMDVELAGNIGALFS
jgi:hypothetical protein